MYLNYFGIVDKTNKNVNDTISYNAPTASYRPGYEPLVPTSQDRYITYQKTRVINEISKTYPLMVPSDYSEYMNTDKKVNPVTILDAKNRAKLEGPTNGFKYQDQSIDIEGVVKMISNQYTYQSIVLSLPNTIINSEEKNTKGREMTPEELEVILATYKKYDDDISKVINNTIVLIGR